MDQLLIFPEFTSPPERPLNRRCTAGRCGDGPAGETCGTCKHIVRVHHNNGKYLKCGLAKAGWTHGAGSDIKARWAACEKWEKNDAT
jgi:hypothetical protein